MAKVGKVCWEGGREGGSVWEGRREGGREGRREGGSVWEGGREGDTTYLFLLAHMHKHLTLACLDIHGCLTTKLVNTLVNN